MKIAKYLILELLFIILVINSYWFFADMDRDNSVCVDVGNYLEFEWSSYFHWFREDLNQICHFDEKNLFMYFWFVFTFSVYHFIRFLKSMVHLKCQKQ